MYWYTIRETYLALSAVATEKGCKFTQLEPKTEEFKIEQAHRKEKMRLKT